MNNQFSEILSLIQIAKQSAIKSVNVELINLYWNVGAYISQKVVQAQWGDKTVDELAQFIQAEHPELKGFNRRGLYRMRQFFETYENSEIVASSRTQLKKIGGQANSIVSATRTQFNIWDIRDSILADLSWTHHRTIFSRCQLMEEKIFYLNLSIHENYTVKELERQISASVFERSMLSDNSGKGEIRGVSSELKKHFRDEYVFEFLNMPEPFSENDLQKALIQKMKNFILELGKDFLFMGEQFRLQVGNKDFYIDLLFYHRHLQCLVAFELKTTEFSPEQTGQMNFYLEALDRDFKKSNENPSIGILLCKDKDNEVVEYALSRQLSPTLISRYKMALPDKKLLQAKLHELLEMWEHHRRKEE